MSEALIHGMRELIAELVNQFCAGESIDNPSLTKLAKQFLGGTRAAGAYTPRDAYDAMEVAVNKYLFTTRAAEFVDDETTAFAELRTLAERLPTQADRTLEQTEFQQFSTPPMLSYLAARLLGVQPDDTVLEPSAGTGSLAIWPYALGARVICNEINPRRNALLRGELGLETHSVDAEVIHDLLPAEITPTLVLMNPPFTATGGRVAQHHGKYGLRHIESALARLKDGGRLVAIAGDNVGFQRTTCSPTSA